MIQLKVSEDRITLGVAPARVVYIGGEPYGGDYEVTPKAEEAVVLPTRDKVLAEDITVKKIPYYETSNDLGETVFIAAEV